MNKKTKFLTYKTKLIELQKKLINHCTKSGKKFKSEKSVTKSFKVAQKQQTKNHGKITKLSVINTIPTFKIVKLTNKKRRKKSLKEIPTLVSSYESRVSLALKYLIKTTNVVQDKRTPFFKKFKNELFLGVTSDNNAILTKNNYQSKSFNEKKFFRFYRW